MKYIREMPTKLWNVNEISKLAQIIIRTLHYYDTIGLLKPSARSSSGYRMYSEQDLLTLEQIIASKICGFMLMSTQEILASSNDVILIKLKAQLRILQEKIVHLVE